MKNHNTDSGGMVLLASIDAVSFDSEGLFFIGSFLFIGMELS
jgi:hypothetical protein